MGGVFQTVRFYSVILCATVLRENPRSTILLKKKILLRNCWPQIPFISTSPVRTFWCIVSSPCN